MVLDVILPAGKSLFAQVAQTPAPSSKILHSLLYPTTHDFLLKSVEGEPIIIQIRPDEAYIDPKPQIDHGADVDFDF